MYFFNIVYSGNPNSKTKIFFLHILYKKDPGFPTLLIFELKNFGFHYVSTFHFIYESFSTFIEL